MNSLIHIVMWRFTGASPELRAAQAQQVTEALLAMRGQVPGLLELKAGPQVAGNADWDLALYTAFSDASALAAYKAHPLHEQVVALVKPIRAARAEVDFWAPSPPA